MIPAIKYGRPIEGISALYLPFLEDGNVDWHGFDNILQRTIDSGLKPAVNMDTGSVQFIDDSTRKQVLSIAKGSGSPFVAGCFVADAEGDSCDIDGYRRSLDEISEAGGLPILFPSHGLNSTFEEQLVPTIATITRDVDAFIGFELGPMFVPYGRIYELGTYCDLMRLPNCIGAKHSSLSRELEWERIEMRDQVNPEFRIYTGNDLGIDMVMWGSDYLLGLSTFSPDLFAERDAYWRDGDPRFFELNDVLQYLGAFSFRVPVPAYKHNAAQLLHMMGLIASDRPPPGCPARPDSDRDVLRTWLDRL